MRRPAGAVLPFALVAAITILVLVTMALDATARGARTASAREARAQAFYLAEAGRQRALTTLAFEDQWTEDGTWFPLGPGDYEVSMTAERLTNRLSLWTLTSRGRVNGTVEAVTQQIEVRRRPGNSKKVQEIRLLPDTWRRL